jgi:hypothetical protein
MRRKYLGGGDPHCFYCPESDLACLELDHPVGEKRDPRFVRVVCRNSHRKLEIARDLAGLTKNGLRDTSETIREALRSYLLLLALDQEQMANLLESEPTSAQLIPGALRSTADSLRRVANLLPENQKELDHAQPQSSFASTAASETKNHGAAKENCLINGLDTPSSWTAKLPPICGRTSHFYGGGFVSLRMVSTPVNGKESFTQTAWIRNPSR